MSTSFPLSLSFWGCGAGRKLDVTTIGVEAGAEVGALHFFWTSLGLRNFMSFGCISTSEFESDPLSMNECSTSSLKAWGIWALRVTRGPRRPRWTRMGPTLAMLPPRISGSSTPSSSTYSFSTSSFSAPFSFSSSPFASASSHLDNWSELELGSSFSYSNSQAKLVFPHSHIDLRFGRQSLIAEFALVYGGEEGNG